MEEKLKQLYNECVEELKSIKINVLDVSKVGQIDIKLTSRSKKRYGCCKQEEPDKHYYNLVKRENHYHKVYEKFNKHHIEISEWVMQLDEKIIKNTIMHEIIHCFPNCNDHGKTFKAYAEYINKNLEYNITRVGNKEEDFKNSNIEYREKQADYKYKIVCKKCGQIIYRQRVNKNLINRYRCGKCGGRLEFVNY